MDKKSIFEIECSKFIGNLIVDMQASNLFFEMNDTVGFILRGMKLYYEPW